MQAEEQPAARALVFGASGAIGGALADALAERRDIADVVRLSRRDDALDLTDEAALRAVAARLSNDGDPFRIMIDATGFLHDSDNTPEKALRHITSAHMAKSFAINTIGPALLLKNFAPLLPRTGRAVFATLSAKVGSIGDNKLGGWFSYRASKAALNQIVRTAAIELKRRSPEAICVSLHPGTVASPLSAPFAKTNLDVSSPTKAAAQLLAVIDGLTPRDSGQFFDYRGARLPW